MIPVLPVGIRKYAETPVFSAETVPKKLTKLHDTKPGVWGRLCVIEGALDYIISCSPPFQQRINAGEYGIIEPESLHHVQIIGPVRFKIEFLKMPA